MAKLNDNGEKQLERLKIVQAFINKANGDIAKLAAKSFNSWSVIL